MGKGTLIALLLYVAFLTRQVRHEELVERHHALRANVLLLVLEELHLQRRLAGRAHHALDDGVRHVGRRVGPVHLRDGARLVLAGVAGVAGGAAGGRAGSEQEEEMMASDKICFIRLTFPKTTKTSSSSSIDDLRNRRGYVLVM